ncbi:MAG: T9SS type A sorting domain-containing protein [Candidatus Latescibacterota bacterium]
MNKFISFLLGLAFLATTINSASATTINVPGNQSTIQAGIDASSPGDTVLVQPGRYVETIDFKGKDIIVGSLFLATRDSSYISNTVISGGGNGSVVTFKNGETENAELCGFTVAFGETKYIQGHQPLSWGGGIYCINASPYLHHLIVENNESDYDGGGIHLEKSNSTIEYCVIRNNRAKMLGGGFYISQGNNHITNCIINSNEGIDGGGGEFLYSNIKIERCVIFKNRSDLGSALYVHQSETTIINSTITDHSYGYDVIYSDGIILTIVNSILWNDCDYEIDSRTIQAKYPPNNVIIAYSDVRNNNITIHVDAQDSLFLDNVINQNPLFVNPDIDDYRLNSNSPCIDAGVSRYIFNNASILNLPKNSYKGNGPDMGANEFDIISSVKSINTDSTIKISSFPNPFNSSTIIRYSLSKQSHVNLAVYSITGQKVKDLLNKSLPVGNYQTQWNGTDKSGNNVSSGVYIVRLNTGIQTLSKCVVYMK